mgnify:CR=1 FL=1
MTIASAMLAIVLAVRSRRREHELSMSKGIHPARMALSAGLELLVPMLAGIAALTFVGLQQKFALFNQAGAPRVTTADIADELNISPGNLYYHFGNKDEIVFELYEAYEARVLPLYADPGGRRLDVEDLWRRAIDTAREAGIVASGDRVVITAGTAVNIPGSTNVIKVDIA